MMHEIFQHEHLQKGGRGAGPRGRRGRAMWMGGQRASRGDVRAAVLLLVAEQPMHGYQIIRELSERSGGIWSPSPGSVYPTLQLLADEGLLASKEEDGKRVFSITDAGRAVLADRGPAERTPWEAVAAGTDSAVADLKFLAVQVVVAARQVEHAGTRSDVDKVTEILTDARRAIYKVLAESPGGSPSGEGSA
ncbi:MAG: PadR family transcriptional regulator [Actinomycetota bacterium]|nr:PadR family transcriptional regulator [Actinomycetota bacterium]